MDNKNTSNRTREVKLVKSLPEHFCMKHEALQGHLPIKPANQKFQKRGKVPRR